MIIVIGFSSCSKEELVSWKTSHEFTTENIMGEEVDIIQSSDSHAIATNGHTHNDASKILTGTQVAGSASSFVNKQSAGFSFYLKYSFRDGDYSDDFSEAMFQSLWKVGKIYKLGMEGEEYYQNPYIYVGLINEQGILQKYVTEVNASNDNNQLEIISREYAGKTDKGRDVYEVKVKYESRLVNLEDENDVLYLKNGEATLKVPNFSQENAN